MLKAGHLNNATMHFRRWVPRFLKDFLHHIKKRTNAERFGIDQFLRSVAGTVASTDRVLDAGAGGCEYRAYFAHARYESTDITGKYNRPGECHTFISELHHIPVADNSYDVIINTQVLEHVEFPQVVVREFYRILKPNGRLFLTTPQSWGIHMAPYHFYNFTRYGLASLFRNAQFSIEFIRPNGGIFWNLAKMVVKLPRYVYAGYRKDRPRKALVLLPFYWAAKPFLEFVLPLALFYLDSLDKDRGWTTGYLCCCKKLPTESVAAP